MTVNVNLWQIITFHDNKWWFMKITGNTSNTSMFYVVFVVIIKGGGDGFVVVDVVVFSCSSFTKAMMRG